MWQINIFVSYSHLDANWTSESDSFSLIPWLASSLHRENVNIWFDHALKKLPGEEYKKKIKSEIDAAHIAILLISPNFAHSDFISEYDLPLIKERVDARELIVIPILAEPTDLTSEAHLRWICEYQMLPGEATPLINYLNNTADFLKVRVEILQAIRNQLNQLRDYPIYGHERQYAKANKNPRSTSSILLISVFLISIVLIVILMRFILRR